MRELRTAAVAVLALTVILGLAYPLAMTGASQVLFPGAADGSLVRHDGRVVGSRLIGRDFAKDPSLFQSRPSATKYAGDATFFNNQGPNQRALADQLKAQLAAYLKRERPFTPGLRAAAVPADAVTTSASGIDPQISYANAAIQANRVARERGLTRGRVMAFVDAHGSRPLFGLAGERSVNVLELNLALEAVGR
jgi:potassium-transporting ATPase KdpC subunit